MKTRLLKTNDIAWYRIHKDDANLMQVIYQIISACFEDDCADELTNEPVMTAILEKDTLVNISCYEGHRYAFEIHQYT